MRSTLEDLLMEKKHKIDTDAKKWIQKRDEWIERVEKLYKKIHDWLKPFEDKKFLRVKYTEIQRREELLGYYSNRGARVRSLILLFQSNPYNSRIKKRIVFCARNSSYLTE